MNDPLTLPPQILYLISFLGILVDMNDGIIVIENLSNYSGRNLKLNMNIDRDNDRVTLTLAEGREA